MQGPDARREQKNRYYLELSVEPVGLSPDEVEALFDPLADAVHDLTDVIDPDLGARFDTTEFDVTMAVDAADEPAALTVGLAAVRFAIHSVDGSTPGRKAHFRPIQQVIRAEPASA